MLFEPHILNVELYRQLQLCDNTNTGNIDIRLLYYKYKASAIPSNMSFAAVAVKFPNKQIIPTTISETTHAAFSDTEVTLSLWCGEE